MKLDGATIAIEQRSAGACLDLAGLFCRAHAAQIATLTALFAVPWCALTYWAAGNTESGLFLGLLFFFVGSPFLGAALVAGAGYRVFGDPFLVRSTLRILLPHLRLLIFAVGVARFVIGLCWLPFSAAFLLDTGDAVARVMMGLCGLACAVPGVLLAVRYGFLPEVIILEQARGTRFEARTSELMRGMFWNLVQRGAAIAAFFGCVAVSLFILLDLMCDIVFGLPVLFGRTTDVFFLEEVTYLVQSHPTVVTALTGTMWLVYPLARLAWFFCYLDVRIRKECWDVELDFRVEARRLEATGEVRGQ